MLYCQPDSFYHEMKFISDNQPDFLQKLDMSEYKLPDGLTNIEPMIYLLNMIVKQPQDDIENKIFAVRTFGVYNSLEPEPEHRMMQVYYACLKNGSVYISKPSSSDIIFIDGVMYYTSTDEYGDRYDFTLEEIAKEKRNPYALYSYVRYGEYVFRPDNIMAMIPIFFVKNLV